MSSLPHFHIRRSERTHSHGLIVTVYQLVDTMRFMWDTSQEQLSLGDQYESQAAAEAAADDSVFMAGHACDSGCYGWRALEP